MELQLSLILLNWLKSLLDHKIIKQLNRSQFPSSIISFVFCELTVYTTIRKNGIYHTLVFRATYLQHWIQVSYSPDEHPDQ